VADLEIGEQAPDFALPGTSLGANPERRSATYHLRDLEGQPVVLAFYPEDYSPVCTTQLRAYSSQIEDFSALGAVMLGISPQSLESHESFARRMRIAFPLLADTDRAVARVYGVLGPLGFYRRSVFVLDKAQRIRYKHISRAGLTFRPSEELLEAVRLAVEDYPSIE
jgi:peroxiredoxin Q/BCP